jgi:hypothetical protein
MISTRNTSQGASSSTNSPSRNKLKMTFLENVFFHRLDNGDLIRMIGRWLNKYKSWMASSIRTPGPFLPKSSHEMIIMPRIVIVMIK